MLVRALLIVDAGVKRELLDMLKGALEATRVSKDVADVATDVGPLISRRRRRPAAHCWRSNRAAACVRQTLGEDDGALFHPRVYHLNPEEGSDPVEALKLCSKEVFAPVLHVVTYTARARRCAKRSRRSTRRASPSPAA